LRYQSYVDFKEEFFWSLPRMRRITFPLVLRKAGSDLLMATTSPQPSGAESGYALYGVPNGEYEIIAVRDFLGDENAFASAPRRVVVNGRDLARNGVTLKSGERLSNALITLGGGAAGLKGKVVAEGEARLPARMLAHLAPAEPEARDEALRFAETRVESDGLFSFSNLAPGKYWLLARPIPDSEPNDKPARPAAWDASERAKLRREAEAANVVIELKPCQRVSDYTFRYGK